MIKSDPRNVGKSVRFKVAGSVERVGQIRSFRGGRFAHAAFVEYRTPSGQYRCTCVELHALEYVK